MTESSTHPRRRVAPLAPDDRRAALIEATLPILLEHGITVSTRQIAQAAGVAEGTIFRVFPDKSSLITATLMSALDPAPTIDALAAIPPGDDLRDRLAQATRVVAQRLGGGGRLHMIARAMMLEHGPHSPVAVCLYENRLRVLAALTAVIEPDRARLRVPPAPAARLLQSMIMATNSPLFGDVEPLASDDIVAVLLDGLLDHPDADRAGSDRAEPEPHEPEPHQSEPPRPPATAKERPC